MADTRIIRDPATAAENPFLQKPVGKTPTTAGESLAINPFATLGITNPQTPNYSMNPIPSNTVGSGTTVPQFLDSFQFQNAVQGTPQWMFNDIKSKYGTNAAWSWALNNAWGDLSQGDSGLYAAMNNAGISNEDRGRIINTYSGASKSNYFDGYKNDMTALGNPFNPTSAYSGYRTQMQTLHPSNITTNIPSTNTNTNTNTNTTNPQVNSNNTNNNLTNPYGTVQSASNFQGYNPYINSNLVGNPYGTNPNATGFNSGTGATTNGNAGDTSINTQLITGT